MFYNCLLANNLFIEYMFQLQGTLKPSNGILMVLWLFLENEYY